jgi:hypothetical protein
MDLLSSRTGFSLSGFGGTHISKSGRLKRGSGPDFDNAVSQEVEERNTLKAKFQRPSDFQTPVRYHPQSYACGISVANEGVLYP